jgi:hypothetical protein
MSALTLVDLHLENELSHFQMTGIVGGHDVEKEKALVELYRVIHDIGALTRPSMCR